VVRDARQALEREVVRRHRHRPEDLGERECIEGDEIGLAKIAPVLDEPPDRALDGGPCEIQRTIVPHVRPEENGRRRPIELRAIGQAHSPRHRRKRGRHVPARLWRERFERGEHVRQRCTAKEAQVTRRAPVLRVVSGNVGDRRASARADVLWVGVEEARSVGSGARVVTKKRTRLVARRVGIAQRTRRSA